MPIFQITATGAPATRPLSTRQLLAHLCSSSFHKQTIQLIESTFAGGGNVFTKRSFKLLSGWSRAQFMHLEYRFPSLHNECVRLLSVGCVCTIFALHHHDFYRQLLCTNYKQLCNPSEASLLRSSCACLASSLRLDARLLTCSREGK